MEPVRRAALYCRVSTTDQAEEGTSLETQEAKCRQFCEAKGYLVEESHVHREAHTGADLFARPRLRKLMEAIRRREVDVVVAYALDRLTRNQKHLTYFVVEAEARGVAVEFVTEALEDTPEGWLLQAVRGFVAELERLKIRERTQRGREARVRSGRLLACARPRYGYRYRDADRAAYDPDPVTAPVVQRVFMEVARGKPIARVAAGLTEAGIPTPTGRSRWSQSTLYGILTDPKYAGDGRGLVRRREEREAGRRVLGVRAEEERHRYGEEVVPALVERVTWDRVRERMRKNRESSSRHNGNPEATLLRGGGFLSCAYCGRALVVERRKGGRLLYYRCIARTKGRPECPGPGIPVSTLDGVVWERVAHVLAHPETVQERIASHLADDPTRADLDHLESRLRGVERQRKNLVGRLGLLEDEGDAGVVAEALNDLAVERRQLEGERVQVLARRAAWEAHRKAGERLVAWFADLRQEVSGLGYAEKRLALVVRHG